MRKLILNVCRKLSNSYIACCYQLLQLDFWFVLCFSTKAVSMHILLFNFLQHLKVIGNEGELSAGDIDVQDWKSLRKLQVG